MEDNRISGKPVRSLAVLLIFVLAIAGAVVANHAVGLLIGGIIGCVNAVILFGFATIVDACFKYLKENKED